MLEDTCLSTSQIMNLHHVTRGEVLRRAVQVKARVRKKWAHLLSPSTIRENFYSLRDVCRMFKEAKEELLSMVNDRSRSQVWSSGNRIGI